jgi:hypothetical protein
MYSKLCVPLVEDREGKSNLKDIEVDESIVLKWMFKKSVGR